MKKAAIYIRVSTDAQAEEGYSIEAQKEQLTAYCIAKGIKNYEYYIDGGWSGSNLNRPEIQRLIKDAQEGCISHCLVYKLDRLSRSQKDTLYVIEDVLNVNDVDFISLTESLDTSTPMGRLMIGILSAFAQLERENIKMRTRMGMLERVKAGYWMGGGRVPFGYDYDKEQGILVQNEDAEKVKKAYELYIKGYSGQHIANMLGLKYDRLTIQILKRKSNYGIIEYNGEEYQGLHEPIISKETYDKAMAEMARRSKSVKSTSKYLLTGLLVCGCCGAKMRYQNWSKKNGAKLICYSQQSDKPYLVKDPNCTLPRHWASEVEDLVLQQIFQLKEMDRKKTNKKDDNKDTMSFLLEEKAKIESKIKKLYNLYAESDDDLLLSTIEENKKKLQDIEDSIEIESENASMINDKKFAEHQILNVGDRWETLDQQERQQILRILIREVIVYEDKIDLKLNI